MIEKSVNKRRDKTRKQTNSANETKEVLSLTFAALLIGLTTKNSGTYIYFEVSISPLRKKRSGGKSRKKGALARNPARYAS